MLNLLAQVSYTSEPQASASIPPVIIVLYVAIIVLMIASLWKVFTKAKQPGWASIVPIYNNLVLIKIAGKPWWWLLLMFIPIVGLVFGVMLYIELAKRFGKGGGFAALLILLPFVGFPILAFGKAQYQDGSSAEITPTTPDASVPITEASSVNSTESTTVDALPPQAPVTDVPTTEPTPPTEPLGPTPPAPAMPSTPQGIPSTSPTPPAQNPPVPPTGQPPTPPVA